MKKEIILMLFGIMFFIFLSSEVFAAECNATGTTIINSSSISNGCSLSSAATYTMSGETFYVNATTGTTGAIAVSASNIILDCNGSTIRGNSTGYGFKISSGANNFTIKNGYIFNYSRNFDFSNSVNLIDNVTSCYGPVWFNLVTTNNTVNNSVLCNATGNNRILVMYFNTTLSNSIIYTDSNYALGISRSGNRIYNNTFYSLTNTLPQGMINFDDLMSQAEIFNNRFYNMQYALKLDPLGNHSMIYNNRFENITNTAINTAAGTNISIFSNYFLNNSAAATINTNNTLFYNNTIDYIYNNGNAITLNSVNNSIYNNTFYNLSIGSSSKSGITISSTSANNTIYNNNFVSGLSAYFLIINGNENNIYNNTFGRSGIKAGERGIDVVYSLGKGSNNTIRDNIFYNLGYSVAISNNASNINVLNNNFYEQNATAILLGLITNNITIDGNNISISTTDNAYAIKGAATSNETSISGIIKNNNITLLSSTTQVYGIVISGLYFNITNNIIRNVNSATNSIFACLGISNSNETFVKNNYLYNCSQKGIYATSSSGLNYNVTVSNNYISRAGTGLSYDNLTEARIYNNTIESGTGTGILLTHSNYFNRPEIINNTLFNNSVGMDISKANNLLIEGNIINYSLESGINLADYAGNNITIVNNIIRKANSNQSLISYAGIYVNNFVYNYTISGNNISESYNKGLWIHNINGTNGRIFNNLFYNNTYSGVYSGAAKNLEIYSNNFSLNGYGTYFSGSVNNLSAEDFSVTNVTIHNNYLYGNKYVSHHIIGVLNYTIRNEIIEYGGIGIYSKDARQQRILLENNTIRHNFNDGIQIYGTYYSTIANNTIYNNSYVGITAAHGESNNYTNNNITGNKKMGIAISTRGDEGHVSTIIRDNIVNNNGEVGIYANPSKAQPIVINNTVSGNDIGITGFYSDNIYYNNTITGNDYDALISRNFNISYYFVGDNVTIQGKNNPALTLTYPNGTTSTWNAISSGSNYNYTFEIPKNGIYSINGSYSDLNGNNYTKLKFMAGNYFVAHSVTFYHRGGTSNLTDVPNGNFSLIDNAFVLAHGWYDGNGHDHGTALLSVPAVEEETWCNCGNGHSVDELVSEMKAPSIITSTYTYSNTSFQYSLAENFNVSISMRFNGADKNNSYSSGTLTEKTNETRDYYVYKETFSYSDFNVSTHLDWYRIGEGISDVNGSGTALCGRNSIGGADTHMAIKEKSSPTAPSYTVFNFSSLSYNVSYNGSNNIYFYDSDSRLVSNLSSTGSMGLTVDNNYTVVITGMSSGDYVSGLDSYSYSGGNITGYLYLTEDKSISLDETNPNATLLSPSNNSLSTNISQNFTANLTDNTGIKNATLYIYNSTNNLVNQTSETFSAGILQKTIGIVVSLIDGVYKWFYKVFDWSDNSYTTGNNTLTIDSTAPAISLILPAASGSSTETSWMFSYNVSDSTQTNCSLILDGIIVNFNSSANITGGINNFTNSSSVGSHTWSVNCTDLAGNTGNSSIRTFSITSVSTPASSSSSGGYPSFIPKTEELSKGYDKILAENWKIQFSIDGTGHELKVSKIENNSATIILSSNPITSVFFIGDERKFDLNNNSYYDLYVKLNSIKNNYANFTLKSINETNGDLKTPELEETPEENKQEPEDKIVFSIYEKPYLIIISLICAIIVIILLLFLYIRHKRRRYYHRGY